MLHKCVLLYTLVLNVAEWSIHSLGHQWAEDSSNNLLPLFTCVFGNFTTQLLKLTLYPFVTFYTFHCAVMTYELTYQLENNFVERY